jgi:hypothetical protein
VGVSAQHQTADAPPSADADSSSGQPAPASTPGAGTVAPQAEPVDKRILGVLPNYRTVQDTGDVEPISARRKLWIASKDSFDYPIWFTAAGFAGLYQIENSNPQFGQGAKGYLKRYGASFADQCIGNMLTEGLFPTILREDPRYYRKGVGSGLYRFRYALTRIFVTHTDDGGVRFNLSEILGNSFAVGISNLYYTQNRDVEENVEKLGTQLATDSISNVLKEFWPDIKRKLFRNRRRAAALAGME